MNKKVLIIGGGFAGLKAAQTLGNSLDVDITLIDKTNHHLFQPLLYQVAMAGLDTSDISAPLRSLLSHYPQINIIMNEVIKIDLSLKTVTLKNLTVLSYDFLIVCPGVENNYYFHPEWEKSTFGLKSLDDALKIRNHILNCFELAEQTTNEDEKNNLLKFIIIGGGATGVELAGSIAELCRFTLTRDFKKINPTNAEIVLIERGSRILSSFNEFLSTKAQEQMDDLGVKIVLNKKIKDIQSKKITFEDGDFFLAETIIWAAGVKGGSLIQSLPGPKDLNHRIIVEENCSLPNFPNVFIIGDAAAFKDPQNAFLPGVSPVAIQMGEFVAKNILAVVKNNPPQNTFKYLDKGTMATIGRNRAIASIGFLNLWGTPAWLAWLLVHLIFLIGFRNKIIVLINWIWAYFSYKRGARIIQSNLDPINSKKQPKD